MLPGFGGAYCSPSLGQHARHVNPDLVITLGDVWVLDPAVLRELPLAHWLPGDCRPMSTADRNVIEATGTSKLIAMSRFGQDRFRAAGFDARYVPHAIDFGIFKPTADRAAARAQCGLSDDQFVIGVNAANNDAIRKAPAEMLLAFAKFTQSHPDAVLSLHTGVHQDGGQDLEAIAENLGVTDRIRVVDQYRYAAGMVELPDLAEWYGCLDVLCAATFGEGFGIPIVESVGVRGACDYDSVLEDGGVESGRVAGGWGAVLERGAPGVVDPAVGPGDGGGVRAGLPGAGPGGRGEAAGVRRPV